VTDCPRLIGWSSLDLAHHRSLTSFVVIAGTVCRFQNRRAASERTSRDERLVDPRDRDHHPPDLAEREEQRSERLLSCRNRPGCAGLRQLAYEPRLLPWLESVARLAHRSHLEAAATWVSTSAECSSASVTAPTCLAAHRTSQRAMRWTDFCRLTSSYQYPRIAGSLCVKRSRASAVEEIACVTTVRFASAGCTETRLLAHLPFSSRGRFLPVTMRAHLASDTPVASPARHVTLART
jgi:hypothetical protein